MSFLGLFGPPDVEKLKDNGDVIKLIKALGYQKDSKVRREAAKALGEIGDSRAVKPLMVTFTDEDVDVSEAAVEALVKIESSAVKPLIDVLKVDDKDMRKAAARALGEISSSAVAPLIAALKDNDEDVRKAGAKILGKIGDPRSVASLIVALKDDDKYVCEYAAGALGEIGDPRAVEPLIAIFNGGYTAWPEAAMSLGKIGDARAVEPLIAVLNLNGDYTAEKKAAAWALGEIGDARALVPLIRSWYADKDNRYSDEVREAAAKALVKLYQSGQLDENQKKQILSKRTRIMHTHSDSFRQIVNVTRVCGHSDRSDHVDKDIGVDFPL